MLASICGSRSQKPRKQYSRTVKRLFTGFQTNFQRLWRNMERKPLKGHATVVGGEATVGRLSINVFSTFQAIRNFFEKVAERSRDSGRRSRGCRPTVKQRFFDVFKQLDFFFEKSRWTVTRQWSEVTRPSTDCQTTFFGRFKRFGKILKKVAERSRDSGRRSRDRRLTVEKRFLDVSSNLGKFWKKSLNGHATVVEVTRPSADCQTTIFRRFKQIEIFLKKVAERSRDSGRRSRDRRPTVKQRFLDISSDSGKFWKKSLNGHATVVGGHARPSAESQTTFFGRFKQFGKILKKSLNGHATVVGSHATVGRLSNNVLWTFQAIRKVFWKKSLKGHATVVGGHATVGRLSNNIFHTFQTIWENFEKSHWTVTRQWSGVTRPSADCQTTFFGRFKQLGVFWKKVTEGSRDSGRRSRDRRPTVKQRFLNVSSNFGKFWKNHWTVTRQWSEVTRPSADCQTAFFDVSRILENCEKSRWTVTRQWSEVTRPSTDC